ncbi:MAG TPA: DUF2384 domain-containing protein [Ignavibacteria bacterium]|nr:DUF2384 domain-containing protein [Ignavibacteria bacterium]
MRIYLFMKKNSTLNILGLNKTTDRKNKLNKLNFLNYSISKRAFITFSKNISTPQSKVAEWLSVSLRTLQRYPENKKLEPNVSEKLYTLAELYSLGIEVMGKEKFNIWLDMENKAIGNQKPSELLNYYTGIQIVKDLLGRIEYGVYS